MQQVRVLCSCIHCLETHTWSAGALEAHSTRLLQKYSELMLPSMEEADHSSEPAAQAASAAAAGALQPQPDGREPAGHGARASVNPAGSMERSMQHQEPAVHGEGAQAAAVARQVQ